MYQWQGDNDLAIADYNEILRLEPKADYTLFSRGTAYRDKGDLDQAIADYTEALRDQSRNTRPPIMSGASPTA